MNQINVEGRGFVGAANLMRSPLAFGDFHTIELVCEPGPQGVRLFVDGQAVGTRKRDPATLRVGRGVRVAILVRRGLSLEKRAAPREQEFSPLPVFGEVGRR